MIVRRVSVAVALLGIVAALSLTMSGGPSFVRARQVVPTPKGQLGGPVPLPTAAGPATDEVVATPGESEACDRAPVSLGDLMEAAAASPAPLPEFDWSAAPEADAALADAARAVIMELIACANHNDPARTLALYTTDGRARSLQRQGITPQTVELVFGRSGGSLPESAQARLVSLDRVLAGDEDRLRAGFALLERSGTGELRLATYAIDLALVGETWLIEDVQSVT